MQREKGVAQTGQRGQLRGELRGVVLAVPLQLPARGQSRRACVRAFVRVGDCSCFYNLRVMWCSSQLVPQIQLWARELGFSQIGVAGVDLSSAEPSLLHWLERGFHGEMHYMASHGLKRARPAELVPGTVSVITARMDYLPKTVPPGWQALEFERLTRPDEAIVSMYARGRDYHKLLRSRMQKLADSIG